MRIPGPSAIIALLTAAALSFGCPRAQKEEGVLTFSALGELRPTADGRPLLEGDKCETFEGLSSSLLSRDLVMADLAGGVELGCQPLTRETVLRWDSEWLAPLSRANIKVLSVADDHALDCGREALGKAANMMMAQGFYLIGTGRNQKEAHAPVYLTRNNVTISIVSFLVDDIPGIDPCSECTGPSRYVRAAMIDTLAEMKARASHRIVVLHLKERNRPDLTEDELGLAGEAVNFGADLVICYGPAAGGGLYRVRGKWVVGSMGRTLGSSIYEEWKITDSLMLSAEFTSDKMMNLRVHPIMIQEHKPMLIRGEQGNAILNDLVLASPPEVQDNSTVVEDILYLK